MYMSYHFLLFIFGVSLEVYSYGAIVPYAKVLYGSCVCVWFDYLSASLGNKVFLASAFGNH